MPLIPEPGVGRSMRWAEHPAPQFTQICLCRWLIVDLCLVLRAQRGLWTAVGFGPEGPSWHSDTGVIPGLRMLRKEDQEFKASLCYLSRYCSIRSQGEERLSLPLS